LARSDAAAGIALADSALKLAEECELRRYLPEALNLKGKALLMLNKIKEAKVILDQARLAAENIGSRRLLWQIIALQAELESENDELLRLKAEAREIVDYIANRITPDNLRASFLRFAALSGV
jgi:hypothetical protein